jgi:hypothetical protein
VLIGLLDSSLRLCKVVCLLHGKPLIAQWTSCLFSDSDDLERMRSTLQDQPRGCAQLVEVDEMDDRVEWPVFAGIDWGGAHHQLCVVDRHGRRLAERRLPHDVPGSADLQRELS